MQISRIWRAKSKFNSIEFDFLFSRGFVVALDSAISMGFWLGRARIRMRPEQPVAHGNLRKYFVMWCSSLQWIHCAIQLVASRVLAIESIADLIGATTSLVRWAGRGTEKSIRKALSEPKCERSDRNLASSPWPDKPLFWGGFSSQHLTYPEHTRPPEPSVTFWCATVTLFSCLNSSLRWDKNRLMH